MPPTPEEEEALKAVACRVRDLLTERDFLALASVASCGRGLDQDRASAILDQEPYLAVPVDPQTEDIGVFADSSDVSVADVEVPLHDPTARSRLSVRLFVSPPFVATIGAAQVEIISIRDL
jgi:hypothetical protein